MKISELQEQLAEAFQKYGDLEVNMLLREGLVTDEDGITLIEPHVCIDEDEDGNVIDILLVDYETAYGFNDNVGK